MPLHCWAPRCTNSPAANCPLGDPGLTLSSETPDSLAAEISRLARAREVDPVVRESVNVIVNNRGAVDLGRLVSDLGLGIRQFQRRFRDSVGIGPKLFGRIQRFQSVFRRIEEGRAWVDAALDCGYCDQAHLVRDFRDFSGAPPSALLQGEELARHFLR